MKDKCHYCTEIWGEVVKMGYYFKVNLLPEYFPTASTLNPNFADNMSATECRVGGDFLNGKRSFNSFRGKTETKGKKKF